ncbi:hypothetical protein ACIRG5_23575 [Lentzea sp. NPDC102401]|uniref:hypothetical protein n=1 Tax=Lentzea sp. NPDC102401 TaxID=3364128 RepID=UPI0037F62B01
MDVLLFSVMLRNVVLVPQGFSRIDELVLPLSTASAPNERSPQARTFGQGIQGFLAGNVIANLLEGNIIEAFRFEFEW